jgi:hypothetical protein
VKKYATYVMILLAGMAIGMDDLPWALFWGIFGGLLLDWNWITQPTNNDKRKDEE